MSVTASIKSKLQSGLNPLQLDIVNESHKHKGHGGYHPSGESHFRVAIVSAAFRGLSQVARQRLVYDLLRDELAGQLHALALTTKTPEEAGL